MAGGEPAASGIRRDVLLAAAGVFFVVLIAYWPSVSSGFVRLDDYQYVVDNELVRSPGWAGLRRFFGEIANPSTVAGYYQPLTMTSLMIDAWLSGPEGPSPLVFHLTNVCLHAAAAIGAMIVIRAAVGGMWIPFLAALLFALHPAQVESVSWISQRKTVLAAALAVAAVACYLHHGRGAVGRWRAASIILYALAVLAKPTVVLLPVVLPLLDVWPLNRRVRRALVEKWPFAIVMLVGGWIAWTSQASSTAALAAPDWSSAAVGRMTLLMCHNLTLYLGNLVWPMSLSPYRIIPTDLSLTNPAMIGAVVVGAAFLGSCILSRSRAPAWFVGSASFFILLLPALGAVRFSETCVADRFVYLPTLFLLLPLAALARRTEIRRPQRAVTVRICLALFLLPCIVLMRAQQKVWTDSKTLWTHIATAVPNLPKAQGELAAVALDEGKFKAAVEHAERAVAGAPDNAQFHLALGRARTRTGDAAGAIKAVSRAIALGLGPRQSWGHLSMAEARLVAGDDDAARQSLADALATGHEPGAAHRILADFALREIERFDLAAEFGEAALTHDPTDAALRWNVGFARQALGEDGRALDHYEQAIADMLSSGLNPDRRLLSARDRSRRKIADGPPPNPAAGSSATSAPEDRP